MLPPSLSNYWGVLPPSPPPPAPFFLRLCGLLKSYLVRGFYFVLLFMTILVSSALGPLFAGLLQHEHAKRSFFSEGSTR